ncbi:MAG: hypothetical protein ACPGAN_05420 [Candidatus Poseidoniaceae archaeon]
MAEGIVDENAYSDFYSKEQAFRALSGRIFSDENLDKVLAKIREELDAAKMKLITMDGIKFWIRWYR